jgi:phosphoglucomutase
VRTQQQISSLYAQWVQGVGDDPELSAELRAVSGNDDEIAERFYIDLAFGTGGLRGLLGAGTNRMNIYTVGRAARGLCRHLLAQNPSPSVAIAYDSRINSERFARHAARVMAQMGVRAHIFDRLMPTPALSFAVRALSCDAGIVITASHNPAAYNGFKAYGADGCQITPEQAESIYALMGDIPYFTPDAPASFEALVAQGDIRLIGPEVVTAYIDAVKAQCLRQDSAGRDAIAIVYTPLNGAGRECVLRALDECGFTRISVVDEQLEPDGNFPTCPSPNPETKEALKLGLELLERTRGDLLLATDPDCDRVGIAVRDGEDYALLTGNEVGVLLLDYICQSRAAHHTMPERPVCVKTIVTTEMTNPIARRYGVEVREVLTGFKFIGEQIGLLERQGEAHRYIFGFEESYGYLSGTYVRDKDAVNGALLIAEMAAHYLNQGKTLIDVLKGLYQTYGYYLNHLQSIPFEGRNAIAAMNAMIAALRADPPAMIEGVGVRTFTDYLAATLTRADGSQAPTGLPPSDGLRFDLDDASAVVIRPSGTEPKLKIYYSVKADSPAAAQASIQRYAAYFSALFG